MKTVLFLIFISGNSWGQGDEVKIEKVRSIDFYKKEATITFWGTNQVYRMPANSRNVPCLENGLKANQSVALEIKEDAKVIVDCKLYGGSGPKFK